MICDRPDCPIERTARALEAYRAEQKFTFRANTETAEHCEMCAGKLVCWERVVITDKYGNETVSIRLKSKSERA